MITKPHNMLALIVLIGLSVTGCSTKQTASASSPSEIPCIVANADKDGPSQNDVGWTLKLPSDSP